MTSKVAEKTLLMLGGSDTQVHAIDRAVAMGLRVLTCDNRPNNPGHKRSHAYFNVSTTDLDSVLQLAQEQRVDGILSYASDPGALTAAFVSERLGLPGDPYDAVSQAQNKLNLRRAQVAASLPTPRFIDVASVDINDVYGCLEGQGIVVKPVDSSGSKGVAVLAPGFSLADLQQSVQAARAASRSASVLVEEMWSGGGIQFGGDVVVESGTIVASSLGDQIMSTVPGSSIPIGVLCPTSVSDLLVGEALRQTQALVTQLGLRCGVYNVELLQNTENAVTIVDFGARIGGNMLGIVHTYASGFDFVEGCIKLAMGDRLSVAHGEREPNLFVGHLVLHALNYGVFRSIAFRPALRAILRDFVISARPGDVVRPYRTSADRLGVLVMSSKRRAELLGVYKQPESFIELGLDGLADATIR